MDKSTYFDYNESELKKNNFCILESIILEPHFDDQFTKKSLELKIIFYEYQIKIANDFRSAIIDGQKVRMLYTNSYSKNITFDFGGFDGFRNVLEMRHKYILSNGEIMTLVMFIQNDQPMELNRIEFRKKEFRLFNTN